MMKKQLRKAVIPAAGFGTRMLPFAKSVPKELIPLVDKPVLQYVVEEAVAAGADEILIIISSGKEALIRHFETAVELEKRLAESGKTALLEEMQKLNHLADISFVYQQELKGLGDAVSMAKDFAGGDPVLILLGDTVMDSAVSRSVAGQLVDVYEKTGSSVVALEEVPDEKVSSYGIADGREIADGILKLSRLVEKPALADAPGRLAVAARYLFTPGIFTALAETLPGLHGEIQLTDAIVKLMQNESVYGCRIRGKRYDLGTPAGFVMANVEFALRRRDLHDTILERLKSVQ